MSVSWNGGGVHTGSHLRVKSVNPLTIEVLPPEQAHLMVGRVHSATVDIVQIVGTLYAGRHQSNRWLSMLASLATGSMLAMLLA